MIRFGFFLFTAWFRVFYSALLFSGFFLCVPGARVCAFKRVSEMERSGLGGLVHAEPQGCRGQGIAAALP